jgi:hypothetical protein
VSQDLLELVLPESQQPAYDDRRVPHDDQPVEHQLVDRQQGMYTAEHQHAGRDHRGRVQVRRDRGGRGHRARQPEMQRHLRALRQRGHRDQRRGRGRRCTGFRPGEQLRQREGPVLRVEEHRADQHRHGAHRRDQQRHQRRPARFALAVVEPDQEVRRDGGQIEEDEQQDQVARAREPDHRPHEQHHPRPEPPRLAGRSALVVEVQRQVGGGVDEDGGADPRRQQCIEGAETVEREVDAQVERRRPGEVDGSTTAEP